MKTLKATVADERIICTVGNAKNAGKTTVLNYFIDEFKDISIAITSIGLDGEKLDQITILPKPRIFAYKGMIVATAQKCLTEFEASFKVLETTNLMSALGLIVIVQITKSGNVLVAGPSTIPQTKALIKILSKYELEKVFVDGAFSKTTFASISDAIIYCIGASYSNDFNKIIRDSVLKLKVFNLPKIDIKLDLENIKNIALIDKFNNIEILDISSTIIDGPKIFEKINDNTKYLYIPKVVSKSFIEAFIENRENINFDIILKSPTSLVLDERLLNKIFLLKQKIYVLKQVNIVAIAFNPFSPTGYSYDSKVFRCELEKNINLPIFNVLEER